MSEENASVLNQSNDTSHGKSPSLSTNRSQTNLIKKETGGSSENLSRVDPSMESFYRSNPPPMSQLHKNDNHKTSSNSNVQLTTHQAAPSLYKNNFNNEPIARTNELNDFRDTTKNQFKPNYQGSKYPNEVLCNACSSFLRKHKDTYANFQCKFENRCYENECNYNRECAACRMNFTKSFSSLIFK
jgi:hypothetical protein